MTGTAITFFGQDRCDCPFSYGQPQRQVKLRRLLGAEVKYAGFDHIVITGKSDKPCYIWIKDGKVEIRSAESLWGKDTFETQKAIQEELGDPETKSVCIGQLARSWSVSRA